MYMAKYDGRRFVIHVQLRKSAICNAIIYRVFKSLYIALGEPRSFN